MTAPSTTQPRMGGGAMFDRVAPRYDFVNRLMSLGLDHRWRRKLVASLAPAAPRRILDLATGTADVALRVARAYPEAHVTGVDPSEGMLAGGREKVARAGLSERIELVIGDAHGLEFADDHFDGACISFGIRNVPDRLLGLSEMTRVVRPGGVVSVLELADPREGLLSAPARFHVRYVVPTLGALFGGAPDAYKYLATSVTAFPPPAEFAALMTSAGLADVQIMPLNFGAVHLYTGRVPAASEA